MFLRFLPVLSGRFVLFVILFIFSSTASNNATEKHKHTHIAQPTRKTVTKMTRANSKTKTTDNDREQLGSKTRAKGANTGYENSRYVDAIICVAQRKYIRCKNEIRISTILQTGIRTVVQRALSSVAVILFPCPCTRTQRSR